MTTKPSRNQLHKSSKSIPFPYVSVSVYLSPILEQLRPSFFDVILSAWHNAWLVYLEKGGQCRCCSQPGLLFAVRPLASLALGLHDSRLSYKGCPASTPALISLLEGGDLPWGLEAKDCPPAERTKDISKGI
ncbi:Zinc Finger Protein 19 [Manis pentadactyla]|nr:Zinc Finger Protein 19 [Manis pentadactyla]